MKSRRIKIAVKTDSEEWKNIQSLISANYYFELPKTFIPEGEEKGANFVPEFINYDQSLVAFNGFGSDPYLRPFLYLNVVCVKNDKIEEAKIEEIISWIENNNILETTYLVILIQDKKVFGNPKPVNIDEIMSSIKDEKDIINFSVKQRKQTQELIEEVKNSIKDHIINDCNKYKNGVNNRLKETFANQQSRQRLTVWRNLLYFFFGFYNISLKGFARAYKILARFGQISLAELLKHDIDAEQVTTHPFTEKQEPIDSLMFSLHGEMAVSYAKADFASLVNYFFKHFGLMRSKCTTKEEDIEVSKWGEKAINTILSFGEMMTHPRVASHLLFRKLQLIKERNGSPKDISTLYRTLRKLLPGRVYTITSLDTDYLSWKSEKRKEKMKKDKNNSELTENTSNSNLNENESNSNLNENESNSNLTDDSTVSVHPRVSRQKSIYIDFEQADEADAINNFTKEEKNRPSMLGWPNVTSVLETIFKDKISKGEYDLSIPYAIRLLSDSSQFARKAAVFDSLTSNPNSVSIKSPFSLKITIKTDAFERVVNASTPIDLIAEVQTPKWLPLNFDTTLLRLIRPSGPTRMSMVSQQDSLSSLPTLGGSTKSSRKSNRMSAMGNDSPLSDSPTPLHNRSRSQSLSLTPSPSQEFTNQSESLYPAKGLTFSSKNNPDENDDEKVNQKANSKYNEKRALFKDVCIRAPGNWFVAIIGFRFKNLTIYYDLMPKNYMIKVDKGLNAPITVDFPKVFRLNKGTVSNLKAVMKIDYSNIASVRCFHQLSFIDDIDGLIENCKMNEVNLSVVDKRTDKKNKRSMINSNIQVSNNGTTSYQFERSLSKSNLNLISAGNSLTAQSPLSLTSFESSFEIPMLNANAGPSLSAYASIPPQNGTATFSDGSTAEFQIDKDGRFFYLSETSSPILKVATIPFTFNIDPKGTGSTDEDDDNNEELRMPSTTALLVDSKIDAHKWQVAFVHALECPLVCRSRIVTKKVVHVELHNKCEVPLTIQKVTEKNMDKSPKITIQPGRMYYLIHTHVHKPLKVLVSDGFGEPIEKVWNFDKSMICPELISKIEKRDEYPSGVPINVEFDLPACSYKYLKSDSFAVVGVTKANKFEGGKVNFQIIPVAVGVIETPNMKINGVVHSVLPKFINVTSSSVMSVGPLLDKSC